MGTTLRHPERPLASAVGAEDHQAIHDLYYRVLDAWSRGDGAGYGALFTEDADYVGFDGSHTKGRRQIASSHQLLFDRWLKGTRLIGRITNLRFLSPGVALVHATGGTVFPGKTQPRPSRDSIQTLLAIKESDGWRFTAFQNTRILNRTKFQWILFGILDRILSR